nr:unnamed protein product [Callosobruchus analis]
MRIYWKNYIFTRPRCNNSTVDCTDCTFQEGGSQISCAPSLDNKVARQPIILQTSRITPLSFPDISLIIGASLAVNILNSAVPPCNQTRGKTKLISLTFCTASISWQYLMAVNKYRLSNDVSAISLRVLSFRIPCQLVMFFNSFNPPANCRWKNGDLLSDSLGVMGMKTSCSKEVFNLCKMALKRLCKDLLAGPSVGNRRMYLFTDPTSLNVWELDKGSQHLKKNKKLLSKLQIISKPERSSELTISLSGSQNTKFILTSGLTTLGKHNVAYASVYARRVFTENDNEDEEDEPMDVQETVQTEKNAKKKDKDKSKQKQTNLSKSKLS